MAEDLTLEAAERILAAAKKKAADLGTRMDIAVVDAGGNLKAFVRMDGAWLGSIDISIRKARTARWFDMNTGEIGKLSQPGGPLFGIEHSNGGLITFPGGVPLKDSKGNVLGGVGVSGSTVENDHAVAVAAAEALTYR
jgi:uncharacterized protein GlcG (DUF336 family)